MALSQSILDTIEANPVVARPAGTIPCALQPFGCNGFLTQDRLVAITEDGEKIGTCADYVTHTNIVRAAGRGSEPQLLFNWIITKFRELNPPVLDANGQPVPVAAQDRKPNMILDFRRGKRRVHSAV